MISEESFWTGVIAVENDYKATISKIFYLKIMFPKSFQWFIKS